MISISTRIVKTQFILIYYSYIDCYYFIIWKLEKCLNWSVNLIECVHVNSLDYVLLNNLKNEKR